MNQPKPDSPPYCWVDHVEELQALVPETDARFSQYEAMLRGNVDPEVLDVAAFCALPQPAFTGVTIPKLLDGTWKQELKNCALASVYYRLCEEIIDLDMLKLTTVTVTAAQLKTWPWVPIKILDYANDNIWRIPVLIVAEFVAGGSYFSGSGYLGFGFTGGAVQYFGSFAPALITSGSQVGILPIAASVGVSANVARQSIYLDNSSVFYTGTGTLTLFVYYLEIPLV